MGPSAGICEAFGGQNNGVPSAGYESRKLRLCSCNLRQLIKEKYIIIIAKEFVKEI